MVSLEEVSKITKKHLSMIKGCYVFGSRVYGTFNEHSDWDILLIANSSSNEMEYKIDNYNIHIITPDVFEKLINDNHIKAIECLFAPSWAQLKPYSKNFVLKKNSFRHNISHTVSNSWVKSKKKIEKGEYYIGIKSIFHSLRIAMFASYFIENKSIDFSIANDLWLEMNSKKWTWDELNLKYKEIKNQILSEFRIKCPKN